MQSIENEIYGFSDLFFKDIGNTVEDGMKLLGDNHLFQPKENYIILIEYLDTTINHFKNLDHTIMDETLKKLYRDVISLYTVYQQKDDQIKDIKELFLTKFLKRSPIFTTLSTDIMKYKNTTKISIDDQKRYKKLILTYKELQRVYFESFKNIFNNEKKYFLHSLLLILNSKTFYLDYLLWIKASQSDIILRSLNGLKPLNKTINSRSYIQHRLKIIIPYSKDYEYLQKCLKVYK